jgi:hypothetical protein
MPYRTQRNSVFRKFFFFFFFDYLKKRHPNKPLVLITDVNLAIHPRRIQRSRNDELLV